MVEDGTVNRKSDYCKGQGKAQKNSRSVFSSLKSSLASAYTSPPGSEVGEKAVKGGDSPAGFQLRLDLEVVQADGIPEGQNTQAWRALTLRRIMHFKCVYTEPHGETSSIL